MTPQRILFASLPLDGHFSPMTGLAVYLHQQGHDVRWYVGGHYGPKVETLGLHHYPFVKALAVTHQNMDALFPERANIRNAIAKLRFDINQVFLGRAPEFVADLTAIHREWPYDLIVHDVAFVGGSFIRELLPVKSVAVGVIPLPETDEQVGPSGMGMPPGAGYVGRLVQRLLRHLVHNVLFKPCNDLHNQLRQQHGLAPTPGFLFDAMVRNADLYLQSGVPGFEYPRQRISPNVRFVGPLLPHAKASRPAFSYAAQTIHYNRVLLVTQGTVEHDVEKLIVPTLKAFENDPTTLVIVTTGGAQTEQLRSRFPQEQFIIEDFIPFEAVMPYASAYITNGGYGGVMLALQHKLPIVVAGVHEGKNEIAARIGYCRVGVNLKTETPKPAQLRRATEAMLTNPTYRTNARRLAQEFAQYQPNALAGKYIQSLTATPEAVSLDQP